MRFRFAHIFTLLLIAGAVMAFVIPQRDATAITGVLQAILAPVSSPVRSGALVLLPARGGGPDAGGPAGAARVQQSIVEENLLLRQELSSLTAQLEDLKRLNADRALLGPVREQCIPVKVVGFDARPARETLSVVTGASVYVAQDMPVLHTGGLAGRLFAVGIGGAKVRLVTDPESRIQGRFGRFVRDDSGAVRFVELQTPPPLVQGLGSGTMAVRNLPIRELQQAGLAVGDWVVLADNTWPANLQGFKIGRVTEIGARTDGPLHADIRITPDTELTRLAEVMVMNR